ncbi:hypothetical protein LTR62_006844 [Meristemomyces frigidus]|uniref:Uncharacterized protein n=1 Tax=Meristemomyces frigidus TaxID=1508187 RepID=A0AAN7TBC5_9PEZI|nr:hypothetical protein LTR62_006844 [Meristemomyces frigidus]
MTLKVGVDYPRGVAEVTIMVRRTRVHDLPKHDAFRDRMRTHADLSMAIMDQLNASVEEKEKLLARRTLKTSQFGARREGSA